MQEVDKPISVNMQAIDNYQEEIKCEGYDDFFEDACFNYDDV